MRPAKLTGSGRGICALAHYRYQLAQAMSGRGGQGRSAHCGDRGGQSIIGRGTGVGKAIDTKFDPQLVSTGSKVSPFWLHPLAILAGDYPEAIVFYLVQPLITRWRARGCCGKAWGNEAGWKGMLGT